MDFCELCQFIRLIFDIVKLKDKKLYKHLKKARLEPYVALSWFITWFAHDVKSLDEIARVYDAIYHCRLPYDKQIFNTNFVQCFVDAINFGLIIVLLEDVYGTM